MVLDATFNNISVISRRSALLVEDNLPTTKHIYNVSKKEPLGCEYEWKCILSHGREKRIIYIG